MKIAFYVARFGDEKIPTSPNVQYLAAYLIKHNGISEKDILFAGSAQEIINFKPDVLGVSSVSQTINNAIEVTKAVKRSLPDLFTVIGGYHITGLPYSLNDVFDAGIIGEGELTLSELLEFKQIELKQKNNVILKSDMANINGLCFRDNSGAVIKTREREFIKDIDTLPMPLFKYKEHEKEAFLFPSRGCPYHCKYCASHSFWGGYRAHGAKYLMEQIDYIYNTFGIKRFVFADDLFIVPKTRLKELRDLLKQKDYADKIEARCFVRVNIFDEETCVLLKEIGVKKIRFGMESASPKILEMYKDKPFTIEKVEEIIQIGKKHGMEVCSSFMFGYPGETVEDIHATRDFLVKHKGQLSIMGFYLIQPVPGSKLWDECQAKDLISPDMDFSKLVIDLSKKDFPWDKALYLNNEITPLERFKKEIEDVRTAVL